MTDLLTSEVRSSGHILQPRPVVLGQEILVVSKVAPSVDQPPWPRKPTWTDAIDDGPDHELVLISDLDEADLIAVTEVAIAQTRSPRATAQVHGWVDLIGKGPA